MNQQYTNKQKSFYNPGSIHLSVFFKADSLPEVLANEHLENIAINKSCFMDITKLNPNFPDFRE